MQFGKLDNVLNIGPEQADNVHGYHDKSLIVLHETVSPDIQGWDDVKSVSKFLDNEDYGIHAIIDYEGNVAVAYKYGKAIFYHATSSGTKGNGMVNTRGIGIELVSRVMLDKPTMAQRYQAWWGRQKQLEAAAKLVAIYSGFQGVPLINSDSSGPGLTTHFEVTHRWGVTGGHTDCWPKALGGYFPKGRVLLRAKYYKALGY